MRIAKNANYLQKRFDKNANVLHIYIGHKMQISCKLNLYLMVLLDLLLQFIYEV